VQRLDALLGAAAKPLQDIDEAVQRQLLVLALAIGKHLARREIRTNSGDIIALIRECVERLPAPARDVRIRLHPDDAAIVREHLAQPAAERAWTLVEDPMLTRGGCLVLTESSRIDQRFESRVNAIVSGLLGDERAAERSEAGAGEPGARS
jgi:flagellar assembly protein FliH